MIHVIFAHVRKAVCQTDGITSMQVSLGIRLASSAILDDYKTVIPEQTFHQKLFNIHRY